MMMRRREEEEEGKAAHDLLEAVSQLALMRLLRPPARGTGHQGSAHAAAVAAAPSPLMARREEVWQSAALPLVAAERF